jgi:hypothetical protein
VSLLNSELKPDPTAFRRTTRRGPRRATRADPTSRYTVRFAIKRLLSSVEA